MRGRHLRRNAAAIEAEDAPALLANAKFAGCVCVVCSCHGAVRLCLGCWRHGLEQVCAICRDEFEDTKWDGK